ncbi:uncharacterized protein LOC141616716 [Silene latifolia]|uniref:uncharacterized protein LOC141616716 n=1 Tax=Silene latifolia TaxID=37657 RepID=UPI003D783817
MISCDSRKIRKIENLDRISQLPEPLILDILSRLPCKDSARASVLSKTWKTFCSLYPILYFDHNLFALQSLVSDEEGGRKPDISQINDMFMDDVDYHLSRTCQLYSPIRKLSLTVAINDPLYFSCVDTWLELVRQINVPELCICVETVDYRWRDYIPDGYIYYEFPLSLLLASKGLRSVYVQGCKFGSKTFIDDSINIRGHSFFTLQQLCLKDVHIGEQSSYIFENLIRCCQGIEILVLDNCCIEMEFLKLSRFPRIKKTVLKLEDGWLNDLDIVDTNLQCLECESITYCHFNSEACAGIRELLLNCSTKQPELFKNLTTTFPLLEQIDFVIFDDDDDGYNYDTLKAANSLLRTLKFFSDSRVHQVKEVHIDCPNLTLLHCQTNGGLTELYVNCPKLRQFYYSGDTIPERVFFSSTAALKFSQCNIEIGYYNISRLINLRAFLVDIMGTTTYLTLKFSIPMETFKPEEVDAIQAAPRYNVHLTVTLSDNDMQNVAAFVDGVLWSIRPSTLTVSCKSYYFVKYLCENLAKKSHDNIYGEKSSHPCWFHLLQTFQVWWPLDIPDIKGNLAALPEQCRKFTSTIRFKFYWCYE